MKFMNAWEIDEACDRWHLHPILGPATQTLRNLRDCADANSDGWAYWPKPCRAACRLQELIMGDGTWKFYQEPRDDATIEALKAAYRPIKAFLTRSGLSCTVVQP